MGDILNDNIFFLLIKKCYFFLHIYFIVLIPTIKTIIYLSAFNLISDDILLITDDGIIIYNIVLGNKILINSFNYTIDYNLKSLMNFVQYPSNEEGYIFCSVNTHFYIISNIDNSLIYSTTIDEIHEKIISITPYKSKDNQFIV